MITGLEDKLVDYYVEAIDSRGNITRSDIQHVWVGSGTTTPGGVVEITPNPAVAGQTVALTYDPAGGPLAGASQVYLHYGFNDWQTVAQDILMSWNAADAIWNVNVPVAASASQLDIVFNNGAGLWHNNNGQDWHFNVMGTQGPAFVMDGVRDSVAQSVTANGTRHLYAAISGDTLYVASEDAGEGNDVFIYLADTPGPLVAANWAKAGQIAQWDAVLADENDNDYEAWADAVGATQAATGANGGVLEGTINLAQEFGALPNQIYLAVGVYASANGGALITGQQVPASVDGNGNLNGVEYFLLQLVVTPGDYNRDGHVNDSDYTLWLTTLGTSDPRADGNSNGVVDAGDYIVWRKNKGASAGGAYLLSSLEFSATAVPEPAALALALFALSSFFCTRRR
jgi:hypothetical protein